MNISRFPGGERELPKGCRWQTMAISPDIAERYLVAPLNDFLSEARQLDRQTRATLDDARITCLAVAGMLATTSDQLRCRQLGLEDRTDIELLNNLCVVLARLGRELEADPLKRVRQRLEILLDPRRGVGALY